MVKSALEVREQIIERMNNQNGAEKFNNPKNRWEKIQAYYELMHDEIIESSKKGVLGIDIYQFDWDPDWTKSPPEFSVWCSTRDHALPMYPQYPAVGYYLDFADPHRKIAIEVDGAAYHDHDKDIIRDRRLADNGWVVYRIPASKTFSKIKAPDVDFMHNSPELQKYQLQGWLTKTSDGAIFAIKAFYYKKSVEDWARYFGMSEYGDYQSVNFLEDCHRVLTNSCNVPYMVPDVKHIIP